MENQNLSAQDIQSDTESVGSSTGQRIYNRSSDSQPDTRQNSTIAPQTQQVPPAGQAPNTGGEPPTIESQNAVIDGLRADLLKSNNRSSLLHGIEDNPKAGLALLANHFGVKDFGAPAQAAPTTPVPPVAPEFNIPEHNADETPAQYIKRAMMAVLPTLQQNMQAGIQPEQETVTQQIDPAQAGILAEQNKQRVTAGMSYMDAKYAGWRTHEKAFIDTLKQHPTLGQDLDRLYSYVMSGVTPGENLDKRNDLVNTRVDALNSNMVNVGDQRGSSSSFNTMPKNKGLPTFDEAWAASKRALIKS